MSETLPFPRLQAGDEKTDDALRIGLITDLHYADKPDAGKRHYRESIQKLSEASRKFREERVAFVVELGDLIDSAPTVEGELGYLKTINGQFAELVPNRYYVLGNHCVENLTKSEFLAEVGQERSWFSFDRADCHFVFLDACFRKDSVPYGRKNADWKDAFIPREEMEWLKQDLHAAHKPSIVFVHQRLDLDNHYAPANAADIRTILEDSGKVSAVFQGHSHANDYREINGIHYCTLVAMIEGAAPENNGYSVLDIHSDGTLRLSGYRHQKSRTWPGA